MGNVFIKRFSLFSFFFLCFEIIGIGFFIPSIILFSKGEMNDEGYNIYSPLLNISVAIMIMAYVLGCIYPIVYLIKCFTKVKKDKNLKIFIILGMIPLAQFGNIVKYFRDGMNTKVTPRDELKATI